MAPPNRPAAVQAAARAPANICPAGAAEQSFRLRDYPGYAAFLTVSFFCAMGLNLFLQLPR